MDERTLRIGRNEALFREVNERIERVSGALQATAESLGILCECGEETCMEQIDVPLPDYRRVRADSTLFLVRPGHEQTTVETVVERQDGYAVVRKNPGPPADLARELDSGAD